MIGTTQEKFSFNVKLNSFSSSLPESSDVLGLWHNEAVIKVLDKLVNSPFLPKQKEFDNLLITSLEDFCTTKGINVKLDFAGDYEVCLDNAERLNICSSTELSDVANNVLCRIQSNANDFINENISIEEFTVNAENLRLEAESLQKDSDKMICGLVASISKNSFNFWNENFERYYNSFKRKFATLISNDNSSNNSGPFADMTLNTDVKKFKKESFRKILWGLVGLSDAGGAWTWATWALPFTSIFGATAAGFAGACGHSLTSMIGQVIASL